MKKLLLGALLLAMLPATQAIAEDGQALYLAKTCGACHGVDGKTPILPVYPSLVGQSKEYILAQMLDIKSGARSNGQSAAMMGIMAMVSDEEAAAIADYLAGL